MSRVLMLLKRIVEFSSLTASMACCIAFGIWLAPSPLFSNDISLDNDEDSRWREELIQQASSVPPDEILESNGAVIGEIYVQTDDIFDLEEEGENSFLYQLANRLHVTTRPTVIEKRLLFTSGEPYSRRLLEETARLLRSLDYIYDAQVMPVRYSRNRVDILVITRDVWTLSLGAGFDRSGGANSVQFHIEESNLLGSGRGVDVKHVNDPDRETFRMRYVDQHLFNTRAELRLWYATNSDGHRKVFDLAHPFYSLDTRWAGSLKLISDRRTDRIYDLGEEVQLLIHDRRFAEVQGGLSKGYRDGQTKRWLFGYTYEQDTFRNPGDPVDTGPFEPGGPGLPGGPIIITPPSGAPPPVTPRRLSYLWVGLESIEDGFVTLRNMDQINRTEDFNFGREIRARLGYSAEALGAFKDQFIFSADVRFGWNLNRRQNLFLTAYNHGRWGSDGHENVHLGTQIRYYLKTFKRHRFIATFRAARLWNPDEEIQLLLGGETGLRGYPRRIQDGDRRFALNLEQRFYTNWELFKVVHVGAAVFYDVGRAWYGDARDEDRELLHNIGVGLRLGSTRSSQGRLVHLDVAYPLTGDEREVQYLVTTQRNF